MRWFYAMAIAPLMALGLTTAASAEECYDVELIDAADYDWHMTSWFSINNSGDMAGNNCAEDSECELWDDQGDGAIYDAATGDVETFAAPDGYNMVQMVGMNESGDVVGTAIAGDGSGGIAGAVAFTYEDGEATVMEDPIGAGYYAATDINASGTILGYSLCLDTTVCARVGWVMDKHGEVTTIEVEEAWRTIPFAINSSGDIAGYFQAPPVYAYEVFILPKNGEIEILTDFWDDYREYWAYGLTNDGTLVGNWIEYDPTTFAVADEGAYVWVEGEDLQTVDVLDFTDTRFHSINESGEIAGTADGQTEGILLTPTTCE